jgi:hypothetical protein
MIFNRPQKSTAGGALVAVIILIFAMSVALLAIHNYTDGVGRETSATDAYLCANAAAGAAVDTVVGRLIQWINANAGYGPSIADCATVGVPGNATFPAIAGTITFPSGSTLSNYTVSTPVVDPVLPDDTIVTNASSAEYLPNVSQRYNISDNSPSTPDRYYFTHSGSEYASDVPSRSITYKISVTVTPKVKSLGSANPITLTRYLRMDKVSPFGWCTYRNGSVIYANTSTYSGPLYIARNVSFYAPTTFTDSVLYGLTSANYGANFTNGGYAAQVKQTSTLSLVPNLAGSMAVNSIGARLASFETNTTDGAAANSTTADPADMFSTREVIEAPTNPSNDATPTVFQNARIYNQADARIQVYVTTVGKIKTVTKQVVNVNGSVLSASSNPWVTSLLAAVNVNTTPAGTTGAFIDKERSTTQSVQSTDIDVGAVASVMNANPTVFTTGILYVWDSTPSSSAPITGVRVWDAGVLPNVGVELGTDDPIYMRGDFNTGTTLPANATVNSYPSSMPYSSSGMAVNNNPTTESQREVSGYTIKPAGLFGDSITELSNSWTDTNSANTEYASNTTYNLVEAWSTMSANELLPDDTYVDTASRANPLWLEWWGGARRTMSGEEMAVWHSKYGDSTAENYNGGWLGDISYDAKATALKLNWGATIFVRDRVARQ